MLSKLNTASPDLRQPCEGRTGLARGIVLAALMPLAIATNFLGFWLVNRIPTGPFYRITYALMFCISAVLLVQGVVGLLRGSGIIPAG